MDFSLRFFILLILSAIITVYLVQDSLEAYTSLIAFGSLAIGFLLVALREITVLSLIQTVKKQTNSVILYPHMMKLQVYRVLYALGFLLAMIILVPSWVIPGLDKISPNDAVFTNGTLHISWRFIAYGIMFAILFSNVILTNFLPEGILLCVSGPVTPSDHTDLLINVNQVLNERQSSDFLELDTKTGFLLAPPPNRSLKAWRERPVWLNLIILQLIISSYIGLTFALLNVLFFLDFLGSLASFGGFAFLHVLVIFTKGELKERETRAIIFASISLVLNIVGILYAIILDEPSFVFIFTNSLLFQIVVYIVLAHSKSQEFIAKYSFIHDHETVT